VRISWSIENYCVTLNAVSVIIREYDALKTHRCDEFGMGDEVYPGDGVVTGHGKINGRKVFVFSQGKRNPSGSLFLLLLKVTKYLLAFVHPRRCPSRFYRLRRVSVGDARSKDLQGDG
jgi:hypothetical protein